MGNLLVDERVRKRNLAMKYVVLVAIVAGTAGLLFGYDQGSWAGTSYPLQISGIGFPALFTKSWLNGLVGAATTYGALAGALPAFAIADRFGRKPTLVFSAVAFMIGVVVVVVSHPIGVNALFVGRVILGIGIGVASVVAPMYTAEVAPARVRGALITLYQLAITIGIFMSLFISAILRNNWQLTYAIGIIPAAFFFFFMLYMPRSPRWLVARGRSKDAHIVVAKVLGGDAEEADMQVAAIETSVALEREKRVPWTHLFKEKKLRFVLKLGLFLAGMQALTGINAIMYYGPSILQATGAVTHYTSNFPHGGTAGNVLWMGLIFAGINIAATFIAVRYIDRLGRKKLLTASIAGMFVSEAIAAILFLVAGANPSTTVGIIIIVFICTYIISFAFGFGPIVWVMLPEIYPTRVRAIGVGLATATNWAMNAILISAFPALKNAIGPGGVFVIFTILCGITLYVVVKYLPETKDKTLEQLEIELGTAETSSPIGARRATA